MISQQNLHECLSLHEVAGRLGVSVRTIRRQVKAGELPSLKIGRRHLIRSNTLAEFLAASEARVA